MDTERIRQRAYEIWDQEGRHEGRAEEHWLQAERDLAASGADGANETVTNGAAGGQDETVVPAPKRSSGAAKPATSRPARSKTAGGKAAVAKPADAAQRKRRSPQPHDQA